MNSLHARRILSGQCGNHARSIALVSSKRLQIGLDKRRVLVRPVPSNNATGSHLNACASTAVRSSNCEHRSDFRVGCHLVGGLAASAEVWWS